MGFLTYDGKTGQHRTAMEEWAPHEPMAPDFFEWNYITCPMFGANGHTYFLFYCFLNFSGDHYSSHVKEMLGGNLPEGKIIHADAISFCDYTTDSFFDHNVFAFMNPEDVFDFDKNMLITDNGRERAEFSYQGDKLRLDAKTDIFEAHLDISGGETVTWHQDHLGINGFIQQGAPEDRSFYYSLPKLPFNGHIKYTDKDGTVVETDVYGMGWVDRQWGNYDSKHWEWSSFRLGNGERINLYNFASGNQAGTYLHKDGTIEYFTNFKVIQNGYSKTQNGTWFSFGWTYDIPVCDQLYTVEPLSNKNTIVSPGNSYYEGLGRLLDANGNQVGWAVTESMGVQFMENGPYQKNQHNA